MKSFATTALALFAFATPAVAQDATEPPKPVTVTGSVALVSDYRFRGVSQSDEEGAVQGGFTINHESGVYGGVWGSNLAGWGTFGGANMELDLFAGYKREVASGVSVDVGLTWYMYPGGFSETDFAEPYIKVSGSYGPVTLLGGVAYAPSQQALGNWSNTADSRIGDKEDNFYIWADAAIGIPNTGATVKGHVGHSSGNPGLGPNGTSLAPTGEYLDYLIGVDYVIPGLPLTLGVAYVDTDIAKVETNYILPNFSSTKDGSRIDSTQVVFSVTAAF